MRISFIFVVLYLLLSHPSSSDCLLPVHSHPISSISSVKTSSTDYPQGLLLQPPIPLRDDFDDNTYTLTVDSSQRFQSIWGFGGALTESSAINFAQLNAEQQQQFVESYWGFSGNRYSIGRVPMNSCDYSPSSYSFDDVADDYDLSHFDISHDEQTMIPMIQRAINASNGNLDLFFSPWSPPAWMKSNNQMDSSFTPGLKSDPRVHQAWALYFVKFMEQYENRGIKFQAFTVQNEPEFAAPWEALVYSAEDERDFLRDYLVPALDNSSFSDVRIMIYDHNKDHIGHWADTIYSDPHLVDRVWGLAVHWYSPLPYFDHLSQVHAAWPNKHIFASEATSCPRSYYGNWKVADAYAADIIGDLENWVTGWTDWNVLLNQFGGINHLNNNCDAPVIADLSTQPPTLHYEPSYYIMGHFSRYLPRGSIRIGSSLQDSLGGSGDLRWTAFFVPAEAKARFNEKPMNPRSEGDIVVIILNRGDLAVTVKLVLPGPSYARLDIQPSSIHTFQFDANLA